MAERGVICCAYGKEPVHGPDPAATGPNWMEGVADAGDIQALLSAMRGVEERQRAYHDEITVLLEGLGSSMKMLTEKFDGQNAVEGVAEHEISTADVPEEGGRGPRGPERPTGWSSRDLGQQRKADISGRGGVLGDHGPVDAELTSDSSQPGSSPPEPEGPGSDAVTTADRADDADASPGNAAAPSADAVVPPAASEGVQNSGAMLAKVVGAPSAVLSSSKTQLFQDLALLTGSKDPLPNFSDGKLLFASAVSRRIIKTHSFDYAIGVVIFLNALIIGIDVSAESDGRQLDWLVVPETIFLCIYWIELCLRFLGDGWSNFKNNLVIFDMVLVGLGTTSQWVIEPIIQGLSPETNALSFTTYIESVMILRILRLLRLLRALRLFTQFKILWKLVQGLTGSLPTIFSTLALLALTSYVFACLGVELIANDDYLRHHSDETVRSVVDQFSSITWAMITLVQFVTMDDLAAVYVPLVRERWYLLFYFLPILLIVSIALMNLVTAVLVETALDLAKGDAEMEAIQQAKLVKRLVPDIKLAFRKIDEDESGEISAEEVKHAAGHLPSVLTNFVKPDQVLEFFEALDVDGSGVIDEREFVDGVLNLATANTPLATHQTLKLLRLILNKVSVLEEQTGKAASGAEN